VWRLFVLGSEWGTEESASAVVAGAVPGMVWLVMRLLLGDWGGAGRVRVALGVGGQGEEHLFQPGPVGGPKLGDGNPGRPGDVAHRFGVRFDPQHRRGWGLSGGG
jgi:hypothetical protein